MSRKTLGLAAAIAPLGRETCAGRAPLPGGSWVALETDGKPSGTNFSAAAFVQELECAGAVKLTAMGTISFALRETNLQGRVLGPVRTVTPLAWSCLKLAGWRAG